MKATTASPLSFDGAQEFLDRLHERGDEMVTVVYKCAKCGNEDRPRFFPLEQLPDVLNCAKCHAGRGMDLGQQIKSRSGMFPTEILKPQR